MKEIKPFGAVPSIRQLAWFKREKCALFHFGMNTFTSDEWGEGKVPPEMFNPGGVDCRQWIRSVKEAGFKMAILTAKHHDGFCLWQSKYTDYSIKNSPYKNGHGDIVREFTDACREYGIKAGIYLSPWDRHEKTYGTPAYDDYYANQLTELLSNYGKIYECWWDGAMSEKIHYDWGRYAYVVRNLQPDCIIFGSLGAAEFAEARWIGNESGNAGNPCWATLKPDALIEERAPELNTGHLGGAWFVPGEADTSIRPGWFYHEEHDSLVKSPAKLFKYWFSSVGSNTVMLLNIPPDRCGRLKDKDVQSLRKANEYEKRTFAYNLAWGCEISADSECVDYTADKILSDDELFYMADESNIMPVISFKLKEKTKFDCIELGEAIQYGHRIVSFKTEALTDEGWKTLADMECVGYKRAFYFDEVCASEVRLTVTNALAAPIIRHFGIYKLPKDCFALDDKIKNSSDLAKGKSARIHISEKEIEVEFGGIFPFNTVKFGGKSVWEYEIQAFNGVKYETVYKGACPLDDAVDTFDTVDGSYKMRIVALGGRFSKPKIEVYDI